MMFRSVFTNSDGYRLTVFLPEDGEPLWRQPGEVAQAHVGEKYGDMGPWTLVETERSE